MYLVCIMSNNKNGKATPSFFLSARLYVSLFLRAHFLVLASSIPMLLLLFSTPARARTTAAGFSWAAETNTQT